MINKMFTQSSQGQDRKSSSRIMWNILDIYSSSYDSFVISRFCDFNIEMEQQSKIFLW